MAKATKKNCINLELSQDEAAHLYKLLTHIGGGPDGPRKTMEKIRQAILPNLDEDTECPDIKFEAILPDSLYIN
jgi:hypothetical protein